MKDAYRYALIAVATLILVLVVAWNFDPFGRRKHAEQKAAVATQQTHVEAAKTEAVEKVFRSEVVIKQQQQEAIHAVQTAQGSDAPLDPAVADAVRSGLDRMRHPASPSRADGPPDASGAMR